MTDSTLGLGQLPARPGEATRRQGRWIAPLVLIAGDAACLGAAGWLALHALGADSVALDLARLTGGAQLGLLAVAGLYPGGLVLLPEALRRRAQATLGAAALCLGAAALLLHGLAPTLAPLVMLAGAALVQPMLRTLLLRRLHAMGLWGRAVALHGEPQEAAALAARLASDWQLGLIPSTDAGVRTALLAGPPDPELLADLRARYPEVILPATTVEARGLGLRPGDVAGRFGLTLRPPRGDRPAAAIARRIRDLALALPALVLAAPVLLVAGLMIRRADPGPIFYHQVREGLGGRPIRVWKLRTMYQDSQQRLDKLLEEDPAAKAEWQTHFKLRNDPRVLPGIGPLLRGTSIDELPQLINIVMGEMSLVGPRPFPGYHLDDMPPAFRTRRASVVPGLTGLWQIADRAEADRARQQALDDYYIDNRSGWVDLSLILATVRVVARRTGH